MPADCNPDRFAFEAVSGRRVEAAFDGGAANRMPCCITPTRAANTHPSSSEG
jgi:hypothetical protein